MSGNTSPRYADWPANWPLDGHRPTAYCEDCGAIVFDKTAHTRLHSILGLHAWALAVLKTSHIAAHVHDQYDVVERIDSRKFDNWSADALAEVVADAAKADHPGRCVEGDPTQCDHSSTGGKCDVCGLSQGAHSGRSQEGER